MEFRNEFHFVKRVVKKSYASSFIAITHRFTSVVAKALQGIAITIVHYFAIFLKGFMLQSDMQ